MENIALKENLLRWLEYYKEEFLKTDNPIYAWRAYAICRGTDEFVPIPEWVLSCLDKCAGNLWDLTEEYTEEIKPNEFRSVICNAFGIKKKSISDIKNCNNDMNLCYELTPYLNEHESSLSYATYQAECDAKKISKKHKETELQKKHLLEGMQRENKIDKNRTSNEHKAKSDSSYRRAWINSGHLVISLFSDHYQCSTDSEVYKAFEKCNKWDEIKHFFKNSPSF